MGAITSDTPGGPSPGSPTSIPEQLDLLRRGGIAIPDAGEAARFLSHVSFHRLRGYWEPFEAQPVSGGAYQFRDRTSLANVMELYSFDQQLRALLLDAFSHIEVSVRTQWAYNLAYVHSGGRFAHKDASLFSQGHASNLTRLKRDYEDHARDEYQFDDCPIWAVVEVMTFGQLSRWYGDTIEPVRQSVAQHYGIDATIAKPLLIHLSQVRNFCAHHERLWDRRLKTRFRIPNQLGNVKRTRQFFNRIDNGKIYNALVMMAYLMERIVPSGGWKRRLLTLLDEHSGIPQATMGFPPNWRRLEIWQSAC